MIPCFLAMVATGSIGMYCFAVFNTELGLFQQNVDMAELVALHNKRFMQTTLLLILFSLELKHCQTLHRSDVYSSFIQLIIIKFKVYIAAC